MPTAHCLSHEEEKKKIIGYEAVYLMAIPGTVNCSAKFSTNMGRNIAYLHNLVCIFRVLQLDYPNIT